MSTPTLSRSSLWRRLAQVPSGWGPCVVTIGMFDGVHRGHASLIARAVRLGQLEVAPGTAVPAPGRCAGVLSSTGDRVPEQVTVVVDDDRTVRVTGPVPASCDLAALDFVP